MFIRTVNRAWALTLIALSILAAILGALALGYAFDFPLGQFVSDSPIWILARVLGSIAILGAILYPIFALRKENYSTDHRNSPLSDFSVLLVASTLLLEAASTVLQYFFILDKFLIALAVLAVLAILYCILIFLRRQKSPVTILLGSCAALWAGLETVYLFFDPDFTLVSPFRVYPPAAAATLTLFLFYEVKNKKNPGKPYFLILLSALCGTLCTSVGGACLISYLFAWNRVGITSMDGAWMLALGLYAFVRLIHLTTPGPHKQAD